MDIRLQGSVSGIEAAREIRARHMIPIIYLTAQHGVDASAIERENLQPSLTKPVQNDELQRRSSSLFKRNRRQKADYLIRTSFVSMPVLWG